MNIPTSLIVVLLVVAWLVVLVPMIARRRERVPQAEPAGSNFRVLRRASASLRRRPGRGAKGRTVTDMERQPDPATEVLVTVGADARDEPMDAADEWAAAQVAHARRVAPRPGEPMGDRQHDGDSVSDEPVAVAAGVAVAEGSDGQLTLPIDDDTVAGQRPESELAGYEQPVWIGPEPESDQTFDEASRPAVTIPDEIDEDEWAAHAAAAPVATFAEVDDEQLRPVTHRRGRGGFDPEAAEVTRAYRYQQRRRVTLILLVAMIASTVTALLMVNWLWIGAAVSFALLAGYLTYLRRQVRIEAAIRHRRMERLQRSRQIRPEYGRTPRRVRAGMSAVAPGRTTIDLDDDDPGFDDLEEFQEPMTYRRAAGQ